jgi:hypothetical protein
MTVIITGFGVLLFVSLAAHTITHCDLLLLLIVALVHLRAALICSRQAMRRAWQFFCANYGYAVEDVRRDASARV